MTADQLNKLGVNPNTWYSPLTDMFKRYSINTPNRQAHFLGQAMHESEDFKVLEEDLDYSIMGLMRIWPSRFPTGEVAEQYARQPEKIANKVYAGKLGNTEEGDGWKYRGRGIFQLTGKENYERFGNAIGVPVVDNPDMLLNPHYAALSAGWFWNRAGLNDLADAQDVETITKRINGGFNGLEARKAKVAYAKSILG